MKLIVIRGYEFRKSVMIIAQPVRPVLPHSTGLEEREQWWKL